MGYASLALGPLGVIDALIVLALILVRVRRFPERIGAYLVGVSLVPIVVLGSVVVRMPSCDVGRSARGECYSSITGPAVLSYALVGLVGAALLGRAVQRLFVARG